MKLWTIQTQTAWNSFQEKGCHHGSYEHFEKEIFLDGYNWMKEQLAKETGTNKECYPVWVWTKRPDLRRAAHLPKGEKGVLIELELNEEDVLFSDFELWHYVLNYWHIPNSMEESDKFDEELESKGIEFHQKPKPEPYHSMIIDSWQKIFDLDWYVEGIADKREDKIIQGVTWEIELNQVVSVKKFVTR